MPLGLENTRWKSEPSRPIGSDGVTRLQNRVTGNDPAAPAVEQGTVEGVGDLADEPSGGTSGQSGIGIQGYDIAHIPGHARLAGQIRRVGRAAEQAIEFMQLASLALPSDPFTFARVPDTPAVQKHESFTAGRRAVALVQFRDCRVCRGIILGLSGLID